VNFNVNSNILKQFNCALVGRTKDPITARCTVQLWGGISLVVLKMWTHF